MTIPEMVTDVIDTYVRNHGTESVMSRGQLYELMSEVYAINYSSFIPSDYCYNRTNDGIRFEEHVHLFEYIGTNCYRLLGTHYLYDGLVYQRHIGEPEKAVGRMEKGQYYDQCQT